MVNLKFTIFNFKNVSLRHQIKNATLQSGIRKELNDMAIKGAILGDILGSPYEFKRIRNYDWKTVQLA